MHNIKMHKADYIAEDLCKFFLCFPKYWVEEHVFSATETSSKHKVLFNIDTDTEVNR